VDCLQAQLLKCGGWEVLRVRGDDGLRAASDRRRDNVPVVFVWQPDSLLEFFPAGDQRLIEGLTHAGETLACVDARMDLLNGRLRLTEDPVRPQRAVQAFFRYAQQRVGQRDRHKHASIEKSRIARHD
jgi:hypothetical protein